MGRIRHLLCVAVFGLLAVAGLCHDVASIAVAALTDPAKLETLSSPRASNPRLLKCIYWLNEASTRGKDAEAVVIEAQNLNGSTGQRATLVKAALVRNLDIAGKLGCLTEENLSKLRRGNSPTITAGPYTGEQAEVDHVIPIAIAPELGNEFANLELLPRTLNRKRGAKIGQRQRDYAQKFREAGLISLERFSQLVAN